MSNTAVDWRFHFYSQTPAPYQSDSSCGELIILQWWNKNHSKKLSVYVDMETDCVVDILRIQDFILYVTIDDGTPDIESNIEWLLDDVENIATQNY